jgi:hypothetical protein
MPEVELIGLHRLNYGGRVYEKGVKTPVDFDVAFALQNNPRFKVTGLDTREALDYRDTQHRPSGQALYDAILDANDRLDVDDDANFDRLGKPSIDALARILGYPISKEERDAALNAVEKAPQAPKQVDTEEIKAAAAAAAGKPVGGVHMKRAGKPASGDEAAADEPKVTV